MKKSDVYPSNFLKSTDLPGPKLVTITELGMEPVGPKKEDKPVIYFREFDRPMVVNKTNFDSLVEITGEEDSDDWPGKKVVLYPTKVDFAGDKVEAIRIRAPKVKSKPELEPVEEESDDTESGDATEDY